MVSPLAYPTLLADSRPWRATASRTEQARSHKEAS